MKTALSSFLTPLLLTIADRAFRTLSPSWRNLDAQMPMVNRAFQKVRGELCEVGLLADGVYLDQIELVVAILPSFDEAGYVFEEVGWISSMLGYKEGVIYLPRDLPRAAYVPGATLTDVIRHEYGHAWHWLEPEFFEREWFRKAFGAEYDDLLPTPLAKWEQKCRRSRTFQLGLGKLKSNKAIEAYLQKHLLNDFASEYAAKQAREDFAETLMFYLRNRKSLHRFRNRTGFYRKLRAVERAVKTARKELGL